MQSKEIRALTDDRLDPFGDRLLPGQPSVELVPVPALPFLVGGTERTARDDHDANELGRGVNQFEQFGNEHLLTAIVAGQDHQ